VLTAAWSQVRRVISQRAKHSELEPNRPIDADRLAQVVLHLNLHDSTANFSAFAQQGRSGEADGVATENG